MRRRDASIAANPILIGAATLLVTVVGVFLAYNANNGLPFVPTYDVKVLVPDAAELVKGNDVRVGGKRIGAITAIKLPKALLPGDRAAPKKSGAANPRDVQPLLDYLLGG